MKAKPRYYAQRHDVDGCLRNGSFCRVWRDGRIARYMNGDYMGDIDALPDTMTEVEISHAEQLIPQCCGGKGALQARGWGGKEF